MPPVQRSGRSHDRVSDRLPRACRQYFSKFQAFSLSVITPRRKTSYLLRFRLCVLRLHLLTTLLIRGLHPLVFVRGSCVHAYVRRDPLAPIVTPPLRPNTAMEITMELGRNREKIGEVHDKVRAVGKEG